MDAPAGVTQEEGHTGFFIHLPSAVPSFIFIARRIPPSFSHVDRDVEFLCTHELIEFILVHLLGMIYFFVQPVLNSSEVSIIVSDLNLC